MGTRWWILITLVLDLIFLSRLGREIGGGYLLVWLATAAVLGVLAIRTGGFVLRRDRRPAGLVDRGLVFLAGVLLIFPGPLSDVLGLLLLCPPVRHRIRLRIRDSAGRWFREGGARFTFVKTSGGRAGPAGDPDAGSSPSGEPRSYPGASGARDVDFRLEEPGRRTSR